MGTDLFGFVETYLDDTWGLFADISEGAIRNYRLFSCLTHWRFSDTYKCIEPKGLPANASYQVGLPWSFDMGRSGATWLSLAEVNQAYAEYMSHDHDTVPWLSAIIAMMTELCKVYGYDSVRFVFWLSS